MKQGNLFFSIADILDHHQPPAFVLENVKHLVRHDQGRTFKIIHDTLAEMARSEAAPPDPREERTDA